MLPHAFFWPLPLVLPPDFDSVLYMKYSSKVVAQDVVKMIDKKAVLVLSFAWARMERGAEAW